MRQVSIPKNVVEALNEVFDANPEGVAELVTTKVTTERLVVADDSGSAESHTVVRPEKHVTVLDLLNAVVERIAPGNRIAIIQGENGPDGFTLGRTRKPAAQPSDASHS